MKATIITDASYHHATKTAAWACWIRFDSKHLIKHAALFKTPVKNSQEAERLAVLNSIFLALKFAPTDRPLNQLLVQSDCLQVVQSLTDKDVMRELKLTKLPQLFMRHVKGHQHESSDARHYCNCWCDRQAKKLMRKAVKA